MIRKSCPLLLPFSSLFFLFHSPPLPPSFLFAPSCLFCSFCFLWLLGLIWFGFFLVRLFHIIKNFIIVCSDLSQPMLQQGSKTNKFYNKSLQNGIVHHTLKTEEEYARVHIVHNVSLHNHVVVDFSLTKLSA